MKLFLDTNIFLDLILKRENYKEALYILNAIAEGLFEGVILDITLFNIDYIAKKQVKDIREFLETVNGIFKIVGADNDHITKALELKNRDLEDNLQYILAKENGCKIIITNDKDFIKNDLKILSSKEFIDNYL